MLAHVRQSLVSNVSGFLGLGIAAAIALLLMPWWIKLLKVEGIGQQVRADGPKRHLVKQGTPTMGGVVILVAISLTCLLMGKLTTELVLVLLATLATGVLGLIDDLTSVTHGRSLGLTPHAKMIGLTIICVTFTVLAVNWCGVAPEIRFPGGLTIDLGVLSTTICGYSFPWLYIVFCWLMIAGLSNAVNLTDGLDGLAGGTSMIAMLAMAAMAFLHGDVNLSIFCTACAGACLGFLWFNCYPASIFMGDTGSLALGAAFACTSIMTNTEVVSLIIGGLFIVETLSVMIQVVYFHFTHKRVFLMAPIHHHFERRVGPRPRSSSVFGLSLRHLVPLALLCSSSWDSGLSCLLLMSLACSFWVRANPVSMSPAGRWHIQSA